MLISQTDHRKQVLTKEIEKLRVELTVLYKERDKVYSEISDQRRGVIEVQTFKTYFESYINHLLGLYTETSKMTNKAQKDFYKLTDNQADQIKELTNKINSKFMELEEYNKKELIDIDGLNLKYTKQLQEKNKEIGKLEVRKDQLEKQMKDFELYRTVESQKLNKQRDYQEEVKIALKKDKEKLKIKEKRLNKLHLELKKNKNG